MTCGGTGVDSLDRTIETHGPCWVKGTSSANCDDQSPYPITTFAYYGATASLTQNRLETTTKYPNGTSGGIRFPFGRLNRPRPCWAEPIIR